MLYNTANWRATRHAHLESLGHLRRHGHELRGRHAAVDALDEDAGADGVGHGAEGGARLAVRAPVRRLLLREGRRQPLAHLRRHRLRLQLREVVLSLVPAQSNPLTPERKNEQIAKRLPRRVRQNLGKISPYVQGRQRRTKFCRSRKYERKRKVKAESLPLGNSVHV